MNNYFLLMRVQFSLTSVLSPGLLSTPFDVVSMQFCMHYAFETAAKAQMMLENVAHFLRPGGVFIGTIPNADLLLWVPLTNQPFLLSTHIILILILSF